MAARVGPPSLRSERLKQYDAGQDHGYSDDPPRIDRVLMDAEESEVVDEKPHQHLSEDDGHECQRGTEVRHEDDVGRDVERTEYTADEMPRPDAADRAVICDEADVSGNDQ